MICENQCLRVFIQSLFAERSDALPLDEPVFGLKVQKTTYILATPTPAKCRRD